MVKWSEIKKQLAFNQPVVVRIHHVQLWIAYFMLMAVVLFGIFGYFVIYRHGYQKETLVKSAVTTKLFGVEETNTSDHNIWDNADFMVPPKENGAFTVITSVLITRGQKRSECDEDPSVRAGRCKNDSDCPQNEPVLYGNGVMTGKCVNSSHAANVSVCQIKAWCPVEIDDPSKRSYLATDDFRVFIRNNVMFPEFGKTRQNIPDDMESEELETCVFDPTHPRNKQCPIFEINTMVEQTGNTFKLVMKEGAVIEIVISWDCNFDSSSECLPEYSFHRMDREEHSLSRGFHLRFTNKYVEDGVLKRTLYKAYGIRFIISVQGKGRRFSWLALKDAIGSGIPFFSIPPLILSVAIWMCCRCERQQHWKDKFDKISKFHVYTHKQDNVDSTVLVEDRERMASDIFVMDGGGAGGTDEPNSV